MKTCQKVHIFYVSLKIKNYEGISPSVGKTSENSSLVEENEAFSESSDEYNPQKDLYESDSSSCQLALNDTENEPGTSRKSTRQPKPKNFYDYLTYALEVENNRWCYRETSIVNTIE